jgi:glycosyltransferase involved in cell wall biosynthesis
VIILQANKFFFEKGGSERYMFALSQALAARGDEVLHFSMDHPRNLPSPQSRYFVVQRDYDGPFRGTHAWRSLREFVRSREAAQKLGRLVSHRRPDVAHLHNIYHQLTPSIIEVLSDRGIPIVMTLHDYKLVCPSYTMFAHGAPCYRCRGGRFYQAAVVGCAGSRARSALLAVEAYWQKHSRVYDRVDCFLAPSEYLRDIMLAAGIPATRIEYVPQLSPDPDDGASVTSPEANMLSTLPERFIAYVGRLSPEKGVAVLLDAMARLPGVPLVIVGDGPQATVLRERNAARHLEHVTFTGHLSRPATEGVIARSVALVVPSLWSENAPMVVLEAARAGTPVIASDRGGLRELMARTGGCAVAPGNPEELARAIDRVWNDPDMRERVGSTWRAHRAVHETEGHVTAIESIYRRVIAGATVAA